MERASLEDFSKLQRICIDCYSNYFGHCWMDGGLNWYLDVQFGDDKLRSDLNNGEVDYYFITLKNSAIGFIKVNNNPNSHMFSADKCAELEKMYVYPEYKGMGLGRKALEQVIQITKSRGKEVLFLEVLGANLKGIRFYEKLGFCLHSIKRLEVPYFKDEYRDLRIMNIELV
ncbi:GNAT family N-acetyltransferase [Flagellimonas meishanensis]|uniref:GNAT family N-acetyltransferase n=1 Tax=Flagellimonas meishanensis TaxID=2873264 RepID=UPI001CA76685|nr:GNAT family N-acetyltransferase [[Muricauda] meishanensis]